MTNCFLKSALVVVGVFYFNASLIGQVRSIRDSVAVYKGLDEFLQNYEFEKEPFVPFIFVGVEEETTHYIFGITSEYDIRNTPSSHYFLYKNEIPVLVYTESSSVFQYTEEYKSTLKQLIKPYFIPGMVFHYYPWYLRVVNGRADNLKKDVPIKIFEKYISKL